MMSIDPADSDDEEADRNSGRGTPIGSRTPLGPGAAAPAGANDTNALESHPAPLGAAPDGETNSELHPADVTNATSTTTSQVAHHSSVPSNKMVRTRSSIRDVFVKGQVWGHTPEQRVAASPLRRYSLGLRLAIAQADARPAMPVSFR